MKAWQVAGRAFGRISSGTLLLALLFPLGLQAASQALEKETVPGVQNYTRADANIACGGVIALEALPELKRRGFKAVINLRRPTERNANVEAEGDAARAAGLTYINLPFSAGAPDAATSVEPFLKAVADPANLPVYIHSVQAHRAAGMLLIKRVLVDRWSIDKAMAEADAIALSDGSAGAELARKFALGYINTHSR